MSSWEVFFIAFVGGFAGVLFAKSLFWLGGWLYDATHPEDRK